MAIISTEMEHRTLDKAHYQVHYVAKGDPTHELIVFLHPAFGDHRCFAQQIEFFAKQYRVAAIDMLGHGRSQLSNGQASLADMSRLVTQIIAQEGYAHAHIVGVSLGSLIAQDLAVRFAQVAKTLTVVGGYPISGTSRVLQRAQMKEFLKWIPWAIFSIDRLRHYVAHTSAFQPEAQQAFYQSAQLFTRRSFQAMSGLNRLMRPEYTPLLLPLQITVGEHDMVLLQAEAAAWHQKEPMSSYQCIRNAGHCANMDNPGEFNAILQAFITRPPTHSPPNTAAQHILA